MAKELTPPVRKEIRSLLIVLTGSVLCAFIFGGLLLNYYGAEGRYYAKNVILSPETASILAYGDTDPKTGTKGHFIFDSVDFSYFNDSTKKWATLPVTQAKYDAFYRLVSNEASISDVQENVREVFERSPYSILSLKVRADARSGGNALTRTFQDIHFAPQGDYYRVELREEGARDPWAYFYHPGIYQEVFKLFAEGMI